MIAGAVMASAAVLRNLPFTVPVRQIKSKRKAAAALLRKTELFPQNVGLADNPEDVSLGITHGNTGDLVQEEEVRDILERHLRSDRDNL